MMTSATTSQPPPTVSPPPRRSRKGRMGNNNKMPTTKTDDTDATSTPNNITGTNVPELRRAGTFTAILEEEVPLSPVSVVEQMRQNKKAKKLGRSVTLPENVLHINQQRTNDMAPKVRRTPLRCSSMDEAAAASKAPRRRKRDVVTPLLEKPTAAAPVQHTTEEKLEQERFTKLEDDFHRFQYTEDDIVSILRDQEAFETLQLSLRQRSCVTNTYLKLNVHFYVQHVKSVREARMAHYLGQYQKPAAQQRPQNQTIMPATTINQNQNIMPQAA